MRLETRECPRCGAQLPNDGTSNAVTCRYCGAQLTVDHGDAGVRGGLTSASRSEDTRAPVTITFANERPGAVQLFWLDFQGVEKDYGRVDSGGAQLFHTYVGHVWSVRESESGAEIMRWAARDQVPRRVAVR
jgi:hypothetical protein